MWVSWEDFETILVASALFRPSALEYYTQVPDVW